MGGSGVPNLAQLSKHAALREKRPPPPLTVACRYDQCYPFAREGPPRAREPHSFPPVAVPFSPLRIPSLIAFSWAGGRVGTARPAPSLVYGPDPDGHLM